jgi:hypothetical protein
VFGPRDDGDVGETPIEEVPAGEVSAPVVVTGHERQADVGMPVELEHRQSTHRQRFDELLSGAVQAAEQQPVHLPADEELDGFALGIEIVRRAGQQHRISCGRSGFLDALEHGRDHAVGEPRHDDAEGGGLARPQAGGPQIRLVAEFDRHLADP